MEINVVRVAEDGLNKKEWTFYVDADPKVYLSKYEESRRPTKRHKYVVAFKYDGNRPNDWGRGVIKKEDVEIPGYIMHELREEIMNRNAKAVNDFWIDHEVSR